MAAAAARVGCAVPQVNWVPGRSGLAACRDGQPVLDLGYGLLTDVEDARCTAGHELGHVALGHLETGRQKIVKLLGPASLCLVAVSAAGGALLHSPIAFVWGLVAAIIALRVATAVCKHAQEIAADRFAAELGVPLTPRLARRYEAQRRERSGTALERFGALILRTVLRSHPSWQHRLDLAQAIPPGQPWSEGA